MSGFSEHPWLMGALHSDLRQQPPKEVATTDSSIENCPALSENAARPLQYPDCLEWSHLCQCIEVRCLPQECSQYRPAIVWL